jgi:exodeoxyribonuclease V gamma subunit
MRVHRSNRVEYLAAMLAQNLRHLGNPDPIQPEHVAVGNRGTERWLAHALSESLGITANVVFPFPATVVSSIVDSVLGPAGPTRWSKDALVWCLADELLRLPDAELWRPLQQWMEVEPPVEEGVVERRLLGLAQRLADVYDRIQTFRPAWPGRWESGEDGPEEVPAWQSALWRRLVERLGPDHSAARSLRALEQLHRGVPLANWRCKGRSIHALHVFGISSLPPIWLELLGAVGRQHSVDLYLLSPSNEFWDDVRRGTVDLPRPLRLARDLLEAELEARIPPDAPVAAGRTRPNPTLATFGRIARDFQAVLERLPEGYRDELNIGEAFADPVPESAAVTGPPASALQWLQSDILHMRHPADHKRALDDFERRRLDPEDDSIQVHACYSPLRQVEALKDALLDLFSRHEELQPRDVVVMCPDIAELAPLISAVFGVSDPRGGAPEVPYRLADRTQRELNPVADAMLRLLALSRGRLPAPEVLELLALEPVRTRFALAAEDLPAVAGLVAGAGARWGRDADHRAAFDQPAEPLCTWRFAMERLALGVTMDDATEDGLMWAGVRPVALSGASEDQALVGRLLGFTAALLHHAAALGASRSLPAWAEALGAALDDMVTAEAEAAFRLREVRETLRALGEAAGGDELVLGPGAMLSALEGAFAQPSGPMGQQTGAVTFCTLLPERGVPYRVVCLLGMDEGSWPRSPPMVGFDPTLRRPRVGDRDPRDEDRYLLLEALMAARDALLVFTTGRDQRTREECPPAAPIAELIDVVEASFLPPHGWEEVRDWLVVDHALQAFSARNFQPGGLLPGTGPHRLRHQSWSFDPRLARSAAALRDGAREPVPFWPSGLALESPAEQTVELDTLVRFWRSPARQLVRQRLGLYLGEDHSSVPAREPVELDGLEAWILQNQLGKSVLDGSLEGPALAQLQERLVAEGSLPPGTLGTLELEAAHGVVAEAAERLRPRLEGAAPLELRLELGGLRLVGTVPAVAPEGLGALVLGKLSGRRLLERWLHAVAVVASGRPRSLFIAPTKAKRSEELLVVLPFGGDAAAARRWLGARVRDMLVGMGRPVPYLPRASWALVDQPVARRGPRLGAVAARPEDLDDEVREAGLRAARQHWYGGDRLTGDSEDPDHQTIFGISWPFAPDSMDEEGFLAMALDLWHPLLAALEPA